MRRSQGSALLKDENYAHKIDTNNRLTNFVSSFNIRCVAARFKDVVVGLLQQTETETSAMQAVQDELNELRPKYQRYRDLTNELRVREERAQISAALLSDHLLEKLSKEESGTAEITEVWERLQNAGAGIPNNPGDWPLWKLAREIVRQIPEIQVVDLFDVLKGLSVKTSRQAIEAAIATHRETFTVRSRGREKYVSLKGA